MAGVTMQANTPVVEEDTLQPTEENQETPVWKRRRKPLQTKRIGTQEEFREWKALCRGMSGGRVRRFWRLINSGMSGKEAKEEAMKGYIPGLQQKTPKMKLFPVAVFAKNPDEVLTQEQLSQISGAILKQILLDRQKASFAGLSFRPGTLIVKCRNEETSSWLKEKVPQLTTFEGPELTATDVKEAPKFSLLILWLREAANWDRVRIFKFLQIQNRALNTKSWKVVSEKVEGKGKRLVVYVDGQSADYILQQEQRLYFALGRITVKLKQRRADVKEQVEEEEEVEEEEQVEETGASVDEEMKCKRMKVAQVDLSTA